MATGGTSPSRGDTGRHWLCVAYAFPPILRSGTHRTLGFVRHLADMGWSATVLTVTPDGEPADLALLDRVPSSTGVIRVRWTNWIARVKSLFPRWRRAGVNASYATRVNPNDLPLPLGEGWGEGGFARILSSHPRASDARLLRKASRVSRRGFSSSSIATDGTRSSKRLASLLRDWASRWLTLPDSRVGWVWPAFAAGLKAIRRRRPRVLYSTSPYASAHLVGWLLSRCTGIPWVADFRDPWRDNPFRGGSHRAATKDEETYRVETDAHSTDQPAADRRGGAFPHGLQDWVDGLLERAVFHRAARVIFNTSAAERSACRRVPFLIGKTCTIENGFDPELLEAHAERCASVKAKIGESAGPGVAPVFNRCTNKIRTGLPALHGTIIVAPERQATVARRDARDRDATIGGNMGAISTVSLPHGGDSAEAPSLKGTFTLVHCGEFYGPRRPHALFEALALLRARAPEQSRRIKLLLVGPEHYEGQHLARLAESYGVKAMTEVLGRRSHAESLRHLAEADVAVVVGAAGAGRHLQVPNKLFECLGLRRSVLAAVSPDGPVVEILERARAVYAACAPDDAEGLVRAIVELAEAPHECHDMAWSGVEQFSRRGRAERLREVFEGVTQWSGGTDLGASGMVRATTVR